jgi:hypothetical protein
MTVPVLEVHFIKQGISSQQDVGYWIGNPGEDGLPRWWVSSLAVRVRVTHCKLHFHGIDQPWTLPTAVEKTAKIIVLRNPGKPDYRSAEIFETSADRPRAKSCTQSR